MASLASFDPNTWYYIQTATYSVAVIENSFSGSMQSSSLGLINQSTSIEAKFQFFRSTSSLLNSPFYYIRSQSIGAAGFMGWYNLTIPEEVLPPNGKGEPVIGTMGGNFVDLTTGWDVASSGGSGGNFTFQQTNNLAQQLTYDPDYIGNSTTDMPALYVGDNAGSASVPLTIFTVTSSGEQINDPSFSSAPTLSASGGSASQTGSLMKSVSHPLSTGTIAGIVIGVILALALLGGGLAFFVMRRRRRFWARQPAIVATSASMVDVSYRRSEEVEGTELSGESRQERAELYSSADSVGTQYSASKSIEKDVDVELPGDSREEARELYASDDFGMSGVRVVGR